MITVKTEAYISKKQPFVLLKDIPEGLYEVVLVLQLQEKAAPLPRKAGFSRAKFTMAEDFNAPLEDFKDYM